MCVTAITTTKYGSNTTYSNNNSISSPTVTFTVTISYELYGAAHFVGFDAESSTDITRMTTSFYQLSNNNQSSSYQIRLQNDNNDDFVGRTGNNKDSTHINDEETSAVYSSLWLNNNSLYFNNNNGRANENNSLLGCVTKTTPLHIIDHGSVVYLILLQIRFYDQQYFLSLFENKNNGTNNDYS